MGRIDNIVFVTFFFNLALLQQLWETEKERIWKDRAPRNEHHSIVGDLDAAPPNVGGEGSEGPLAVSPLRNLDKFRLVRFFCGRMAPFLSKFTRLSSSELLWALKLRGWCIGLDGCVSQGRGLGYCCRSWSYLSKRCTVYWTLLKTQSVFQCEESKLIQIEIEID